MKDKKKDYKKSFLEKVKELEDKKKDLKTKKDDLVKSAKKELE